MKAIVTGSGGLIGSECVRLLCQEGWHVIGVDNDMRQNFFGPGGTTQPVVKQLGEAFSNYDHVGLDIRTGRQSATFSSAIVRTSSFTLPPSLLTTRLLRFPTRTLM